MIGSIVVFLLTYVFIASEKVDKTIAALLGASVVIAFHWVPYEFALHAVDLNVIFLLVGMMIVVSIMAETGLFEWMAIRIAQMARGNGTAIFLMFIVATAVISSMLDNVTTVILIAPITILVAEILEIPAIPFLILEAIASNVGGTATLIGDPPNVLIGSKIGLTFNEFIEHLTPVVLIMLVLLCLGLGIIFRPMMHVKEAAKKRLARAKPELAILDARNLKRSLVVFILIIAGFFLSHTLDIPPGLVALAGALVMGLVCGKDLTHALEKVEWNSVFFFIGLFMLIGALEYNGVFEHLGKLILTLTKGNFAVTVLAILWFSAIASAIVDNIPLVIAMIPLIQTIVPIFGEQMGLSTDPALLRVQVAEPLYWSLALGACLGGNGTLVGASANVVIAQIARRNKYPITFMAFTKYGFPVMIFTLIVSTGYVWWRYL